MVIGGTSRDKLKVGMIPRSQGYQDRGSRSGSAGGFRHGGRFRRGRRLSRREAEAGTKFGVDGGCGGGVLPKELSSVFTGLADALAPKTKPGSALFENALYCSPVEKIAFPRDAFAIHQIDFGFTEGRCKLVLYDLDLSAVAPDFIPVLDGGSTAYLHPHARIKLEGAASGSGFGIPEHDPDLFPDLADKYHASLCSVYRTGEF